MLNSVILEVAIGLVLLFLLLSLLTSAIVEFGAQILKSRARMLESGIRNLLESQEQADARSHITSEGNPGKNYAEELLEHKLIVRLGQIGRRRRSKKEMTKGRWTARAGNLLKGKRRHLPSYVPSRTFALALLDTVAPVDDSGPKTLVQIRAAIVRDCPKELKDVLLPLLDAADGDLEKARKNIETWFDDAMERVSGWYKRTIQYWTLGIGLLLAAALNADTIGVARTLWTDPTVRAQAVAAAETAVNDSALSSSITTLSSDNDALSGSSFEIVLSSTQAFSSTVKTVKTTVRLSGLPIGGRPFPAVQFSPIRIAWRTALVELLGVMITTGAISFGAPFWFDMLKKLVNLRSSGKPPAKSTESGGGLA